MIHSCIQDNWLRLQITHSVARQYFDLTNGAEFRMRINTTGTRNIFPFDASAYEVMEQESCMVGMVKCWSVVTFESLINHALACTINNKLLAIVAIEYPGIIIDKLKIRNSAKSELAKKIIIINDDKENDDCILEIADKLANQRNSIIHDKPFNWIDDGEGEIKIEYYQSRDSQKEKNRYEDLADFFNECDQIREFIVNKSHLADSIDTSFSFRSLNSA